MNDAVIARPTEADLADLPVNTRLRTGEWTATKLAADLWKTTGVGGYANTTDRGAARMLLRNAVVDRPAR